MLAPSTPRVGGTQVGWGSDFEDAPDHMDELLERLGGAKARQNFHAAAGRGVGDRKQNYFEAIDNSKNTANGYHSEGAFFLHETPPKHIQHHRDTERPRP